MCPGRTQLLQLWSTDHCQSSNSVTTPWWDKYGNWDKHLETFRAIWHCCKVLWFRKVFICDTLEIKKQTVRESLTTLHFSVSLSGGRETKFLETKDVTVPPSPSLSRNPLYGSPRSLPFLLAETQMWQLLWYDHEDNDNALE